jgi:pSer/pThr/pTyr-binding forkhead associated (FHA) protein
MKTVYYIVQKSGKQTRVEEGQDITIGRSFDNTLFIEDPSVSRHHAVIRWKNGMMYICDLSSTNGSQLNQEKLMPDYYYELNYLDDLMIGNIELVILDEAKAISKHFNTDTKPQKTVVMSAEQAKKSFNTDEFNSKS